MVLAVASLAAFVTFLVHWLVGGVHAARPLLKAKDLTAGSRWLNYFCWHIVTVLLLIMAALLAFGAARRVSADALALVAVIAASISILSIAVTLRARINPLRFPASYLLAIVAGLTTWGIR